MLPRILASLLGLFAVSCSYACDLVLWNRTGTPIEVSYHLRYALWDPGDDLPAFADRPDGRWKVLDRAQYDITDDRRRVTVRVPAGVALRVGRPVNYTGPGLEAVDTFPVLSVTVRAGDRSRELSGDRAILAFSEWNDRLFVYAVEGNV
jgi:hypothetical protein